MSQKKNKLIPNLSKKGNYKDNKNKCTRDQKNMRSIKLRFAFLKT